LQSTLDGLKKNPMDIIGDLRKMNRYQSIPSIPTANQVYGYTEKEDNFLEINKPPNPLISGDRGDSVGPGHYSSKAIFDT
jgi:hypothetical protein